MKFFAFLAIHCISAVLAAPAPTSPSSATVASAASSASSSPSAYAVISNHITACSNKFDLEQKLLLDFLEKVKKNEPGVLKFQLNSAAANSSYLTYEKYASQAAIDHHLNTTYYNHLINAEIKHKTKCAPNQVFFLDDIFQFIR